MEIEKYYLGYRLGEQPAAAIVQVLGSAADPRVSWASASSRGVGGIPYDAVLECLARLESGYAGPMTLALVRPEDEHAQQVLDGWSNLYPSAPQLHDPARSLGACAGFLATVPRPAVVVADAAVLIGALDERGLHVDLQLEGAATEGAALEASSEGRGPWPLVAELRAAGLWPRRTPAGEAARHAVPRALPSTQQGLKLGYRELREELRALRAAGDARGLESALDGVEAIVARDVAVLQNTARSRHPGADVCTIGRLLPGGTAGELSHPEQLALGAAVLALWAELGTSLGQVCAAPMHPPARAGARPEPEARIESFQELFPSTAVREMFLEQLWGRASAHLRNAIEPHALFTGDEFLAGIQLAHQLNPGATLLSEGLAVVTVVEQGRLRAVEGDRPPYPLQWCSAAGARWREAHDLLDATERSGCPPWTASIRLASAHHVCPRLTPLVLSFFEFFSSHCWVNAYYSPARGVPGLACHADGTDVFVLQIEGEKHWVFDSAPLPSAAARSAYLERVRAGQAQLERECVLRPGDLLYLPAGTCHAALATTSPSLHLTFAVRRHTALRVRKWWAQRSGAPEELNRSVQRYDTRAGRIRIDEAAARAYLGAAAPGTPATEMLEAYAAESLRSDREATLLGRLLPNIDHV